MKNVFLSGVSLFIIGYLAQTSAVAQTSLKSTAERSAACRADCSPENIHGSFRPYAVADPKLVSPEGRKMYSECVRVCLAPLPSIYFQKSIVEAGLPWFGKFASDCLNCHATGSPKQTIGQLPQRVTGEVTAADFLKRDR